MSLRTLVALLVGAASAGCYQESTVALVVVSVDGGDPFYPPNAATQARLRIDDNVTAPRVIPVSSNGQFALEVPLPRSEVPVRAIVEALAADGTMLGSGATPPVLWGAVPGAVLPVFVQRRDTVVEGPWGQSAVARLRPYLFNLGSPFAAVLGGARDASPVDVYDTLNLSRVRDAVNIDDTFNREASALRLGNGSILLVRGCVALLWNPRDNTAGMPMSMPPRERCDIVASSVMQEPFGGGGLFGGHSPMGASPRVDRVEPDGTWLAVEPMTIPRDAPAVLRLSGFDVLLAGGQTSPMGDTFERWAVGIPRERRALHTGVPRVDGRTRVALVNASDGTAFALGGNVVGSTDLTADDVVIDTRCVTGGCTPLLGTPVLMQQRRRDAVAARTESGAVVVASGVSAGGVADAVEVIDLATPRMPRALGRVASLPFEGLSMLPLANGSVLIAGGNRRETWVYRH